MFLDSKYSTLIINELVGNKTINEWLSKKKKQLHENKRSFNRTSLDRKPKKPSISRPEQRRTRLRPFTAHNKPIEEATDDELFNISEDSDDCKVLLSF